MRNPTLLGNKKRVARWGDADRWVNWVLMKPVFESPMFMYGNIFSLEKTLYFVTTGLFQGLFFPGRNNVIE